MKQSACREQASRQPVLAGAPLSWCVRLTGFLRANLASVEAEWAALAGPARTLRDPAAVETALDEVLYRALDLSGLSRAAVYLRTPGVGLALRAQCGYAAGAEAPRL